MSEQPPRYDVPGAGQPDGPAAKNPWAAALSVLWAPRAVFELVRRRSPIAPAYVIQMVIGLTLGVVSALNLQRFQDELMQQMLQRPGMTEETARATTGITQVVGWITSIFMGLATPWLAGLVLALFLMLFGLFIRSEDRPTFGQYFSAAGYIRMPLAIGQLILLPLVYGATSLTALQKIAGSLSAAAFAQGAPPFVAGLLGHVAPFIIWEFVLIVVALATLYRTSESRTTWIGALMWLLGAVATAGFVALGAVFQQLGQQFQPKQ